MQVPSDDLEELRERLRLIRVYIAQLKNPALNDLDALLSVAEAELERAIGDGKPAQWGTDARR